MPIRQILLLGHTHHDVGYTNSPRIIDRMHARIVDRVIELAAAHPAPGPGAFRWTFEASRPVLSFLRDATPERADRLAALVRDGVVSVTGGYLNMTQLPGSAEFDAAYARLARLTELGIPVRTQQHGDVNGLSWGSVDQMADAGIGRLLMALNPDHGRPPFRQPSGFRWEGPSGRSVFVWLSTHYGFGEEWGIVDGDVDLAEQRIARFVAELDARDDYPWSTAIVHAGNDNRWPTALFLDVVRAWNARHPELPMRTATVDEALDEVEAEGHEVPVVRGEWADWWAHGHGSTAREVAVYREARSFLRAAQSTLSLARLSGDASAPAFDVLGYRRGPVRHRPDDEVSDTIAHIEEQLLLYGEHTWGSWETYSKPHSTFSHSHHNAKSAFAYEAWDHARDLAVEGWFRHVHGGGGQADAARDAVVVVNTTEARRREIVEAEVGGRRRVRVLADVDGYGTVVLPVPDAAEPEVARGPIRAGHYLVDVDPSRGGVVSLIDTRDGRELVDPETPAPFAAVVDEQVEPGSRHPMITESPKMFHPEDPGPGFRQVVATGQGPVRVRRAGGITEISWETAADGIPSVEAVVSIADDDPAIDIAVRLNKPARTVPESVFVSFPFALSQPEFLVETSGAVFAADTEQLPDTSRDWYSIQHAVGVNGDEGGVLWGSFDAPLVQLGGYQTGRWAERLDAPRGHVLSWLANNLHFTNFQASQEITRTFRYRLRPVAHAEHAEVRRFGRDLLEPLQARHVAAVPGSVPPPPLSVTPADALLAELHPEEAGVRVRLRNLTAQPVDAEVSATAGQTRTVTVPAMRWTDVPLDLPGRRQGDGGGGR